MTDYLDYFIPRIDHIIDEVRKSEGGYLMDEELVPKLREIGQRRISRFTGDYMTMRMAELLKDENPFAASDFRMITKRQREEMQPVLLEKLQNGELVLPERMRGGIDLTLRYYSNFLLTLFGDLHRHREAICACLFEGRSYIAVKDISSAGDPHNHGKCTVILETDVGKLVYKPHSCQVDAAARTFMERYFDDVLRMPKAFAFEDEFGAVEFLEKRIARGDEEARRYYYALGGVSAVIKALGSCDMHMENLFAMGDKLAVIDLETLLYPDKRIMSFGMADLYGDENARRLNDSLVTSALVNVRLQYKKFEKEFSILFNDEEDGSAPIVDGVRHTVCDYEEDFMKGFEDVYRRCVRQRDDIIRDIEEMFSPVVLRVIVWATKAYADIFYRLNSCHSYQSEEYYASQLAKLPKLLRQEREPMSDEVYNREIKSLLECEIPFFYTRGDSVALMNDGDVVQEKYARASAVERSARILKGLNDKEMAFEIAYLRRSIAMSKRKTEIEYPTWEADVPITAAEAAAEADRIMNRIYDSAIRLESGELTWLSFSMASPNSNLMNQGLYAGTAGLAVFCAASLVSTGDDRVRARARECLDSLMKILERYITSEQTMENVSSERQFNLGEGGGIAGVMRGVVIVNRLTGEYGDLIERGIDLMARIDPSNFDIVDKSGGICGLITTLCQNEELNRDPRMRELVLRLAERLSRLRTLPYGDGYLWKTLENHPISGSVHGMMGVAEAFLLADQLLGTDRFAADAGAALKFEDDSYDEKLQSWLDLRVRGNRCPSGGNCYGAEGMGVILHRLQKAGIDNEMISRCVKRAAVAVAGKKVGELDHLCCGNMSAVEYCIETGDMEQAGRRLAAAVRSKEANGCYRLGFKGFVPNDNVTLFNGLAGIGYELLRYTDHQRFPCVV